MSLVNLSRIMPLMQFYISKDKHTQTFCGILNASAEFIRKHEQEILKDFDTRVKIT